MLKQSVPPFLAEMKELKELFQAEQPELDLLEQTLKEIEKQLYIKSADFSLDLWEKELGIESNHTLTLSQRRGQLLGKLNTRTPASIKMLENLVIQTLVTERVTIIEHPETYSFDIYVHTDYLIENRIVAEQALYEARPAHLSYQFINELIRQAECKLYFGILRQTRKTFTCEVTE